MRTTSMILAASALFAFAPRSATAQVTLGPTVAWSDDYDVGVGATLGFEMPSVGPRIGFLGDFLVFFPNGGDYWEINGDATYSFPVESGTVRPFALAGLNLAHVKPNDPLGLGYKGTTKLHLALGGGIGFEAGRFRPKVAGRLVLGSNSSFSLFGTLPFALGS